MEGVTFRKLPAVQFTFSRWRAGSLTELGIAHRMWAMKAHIGRIKEMGVGWVEGEKLAVRPKPDYIAVMFFYESRHFWTHLTKREFNMCFPKAKEKQ